MTIKKVKKGSILVLTLLFISVFLMLFTAIVSYQLGLFKFNKSIIEKQKAFRAAEAGVYQFYWIVNKFYSTNPNIVKQNFSGTLNSFGKPVANYSVSVFEKKYCGIPFYYEVVSEGVSYNDPDIKQKIKARFVRPNVANYSLLLNTGVWFGPEDTIVGPIHSNYGIRMDGLNKSVVTSAKNSWWCDWSYGCNPSSYKPGVFGSGQNYHLWKYPTDTISFDQFFSDLTYVKNVVSSSTGIHLPTVSLWGTKGYRIVLDGDYIRIYRVDSTSYVWSYSDWGWTRDYHIINSQTLVYEGEISDDCPVIFAEDNVWLEGHTDKTITIIAAKPNSSFDPDIIINDSITKKDGVSLLAVAEDAVLIPLFSPDVLKIEGVFVAKNGPIRRNLYTCWYAPYDKRSKIIAVGSAISYKRTVTKWIYLNSSYCGGYSGYNESQTSYDRKSALDPAPFTPNISDKFEIVKWTKL